MATNLNLNDEITALENISGSTTGAWDRLLALVRAGFHSTVNPFGSAALRNAGVANGVATLGSDGTVPVAQLKRNVSGGYPSLDINSKISRDRLNFGANHLIQANGFNEVNRVNLPDTVTTYHYITAELALNQQHIINNVNFVPKFYEYSFICKTAQTISGINFVPGDQIFTMTTGGAQGAGAPADHNTNFGAIDISYHATNPAHCRVYIPSHIRYQLGYLTEANWRCRVRLYGTKHVEN